MEALVHNNSEDGPWISISDMMTGLMMIFLFIAVNYMLIVSKEKDTIEEIAVTYQRLQSDLYDDLYQEFEKDLGRWNASINKKTLSIRFEEPEILFGTGSSTIKADFKVILDDFFPRYIKILLSNKYKNEIEEIRIEGHTSSEWDLSTSEEVAYFHNMELSQDRTRSVLEYVLTHEKVNGDFKWLKSKLTANGLSSSQPIVENETENMELSRRVEFRVKTNSEKSIFRILKGAQDVSDKF